MGVSFGYRLSLRHSYDNAANGPRLVRNGNLPGLAQPHDLRGRVPDPLLQRTRQMRMIEVSDLVNGVGDRNTSPQERRRVLGAFDLANVALVQPGGP
jgi:hypothetical protein